MFKSKIKKLIQEAESGDVLAQYNLGVNYLKGKGVSQDRRQALFWLEKAAAQGDEDAPGVIEIVKEGLALENERTELEKEEAKLSEEYTTLGFEYFDNGQHKEAFPHLKKAADNGDVEAQHLVGWMFRTGNGTRQDFSKALDYIELATKQGHAGAQWQMALYYDGILNTDLAVQWAQQAAAQGHGEAAAYIQKVNAQAAAAQAAQAARAAQAAASQPSSSEKSGKTPLKSWEHKRNRTVKVCV
jgi:hypothetical protein